MYVYIYYRVHNHMCIWYIYACICMRIHEHFGSRWEEGVRTLPRPSRCPQFIPFCAGRGPESVTPFSGRGPASVTSFSDQGQESLTSLSGRG